MDIGSPRELFAFVPVLYWPVLLWNLFTLQARLRRARALGYRVRRIYVTDRGELDLHLVEPVRLPSGLAAPAALPARAPSRFARALARLQLAPTAGLTRRLAPMAPASILPAQPAGRAPVAPDTS